jgi:DUF177 domain-containing protein
LIVDLAALRLGRTSLQVIRSFSKDEIGFEDKTIEISEPVQVDLRVTAPDERVKVEGFLKAELVLTCSRCACRFPWNTEKRFAVEYWPDETDEEGEIELDYDDLDVGFYLGDKFDLNEMIREQVLIDLPMNPICREDCKGLCVKCGADLNFGDCGCGDDNLDPRFETLKVLKDRIK